MKYYNYISGGMTPDHLAAAMTVAFMGWLVYKFVTGTTRNKGSQRSPGSWDWKFWVKDNLPGLFTHTLILFVLVRFAAEILPRVIPESVGWINSNDPMWIYFIVGVAKAHIIHWAKKRKEGQKVKSK